MRHGFGKKEALPRVTAKRANSRDLCWTLDVAFDEDHSRIRNGFAQANFVALRHLALSLLKQDKSLKVGIETKRARAGWDTPYLLKLLSG